MEQGIGIDLEVGRKPEFRMARFFLKSRELGKLSSRNQRKNLLRLWTVKEAIFKSDPLNTDTTLLDYEVSDPNAMWGQARCEKNGCYFAYFTKKMRRGFLTVAVTKEILNADR